ncbi:hypothetical protein GTY75_20295 [Streptomyces sp. SID8381]|nr:hypothetical protein [Streptomyces sp. SID8381]
MAVSNVRRADDTEYRSPCGAGELAVWADGSESRGSRESHGFPAPLATPVRPTTPPSRPRPRPPCPAAPLRNPAGTHRRYRAVTKDTGELHRRPGVPGSSARMRGNGTARGPTRALPSPRTWCVPHPYALGNGTNRS